MFVDNSGIIASWNEAAGNKSRRPVQQYDEDGWHHAQIMPEEEEEEEEIDCWMLNRCSRPMMKMAGIIPAASRLFAWCRGHGGHRGDRGA